MIKVKNISNRTISKGEFVMLEDMFTVVEKFRQGEETTYESEPQPKREKSKRREICTTRVEDSVICPFCLRSHWSIHSKDIRCLYCGTFFNKGFIKGENVYSINMNLKFLKHLYKAGIDETHLGIRVRTDINIDD